MTLSDFTIVIFIVSSDLVNNFGHSTPYQMQNNNPGWMDPQLQLQLLQQQQQQQMLLQQQLRGQIFGQFPIYGNNMPNMPNIPNMPNMANIPNIPNMTYNQQQQQQLLLQAMLLQQQQHQQIMSPPILSPNNFGNTYPQETQHTLLNQFYQHQQQQHQQQQTLHQQLALQQLALQHQILNQPESPFVPITHRSPFPDDVSPLSQQKSPLNVALYLPLASNAENISADFLSNPEQVF